jgi:Ca2+-dependent lipid-binding protein
VQLSLGTQRRESEARSKQLNPTWNQAFDFEGCLHELLGLRLELRVLDRNALLKDTHLGDASVSLRQLEAGDAFAAEAALTVQGHVHLQVAWHPHERR